MTSTVTIERLAHGCEPFHQPGDREQLVFAWPSFSAALEAERYDEIAETESDLNFILRGAAIRLADAALKSGEIELSKELSTWGRDGVPQTERAEFIDILLNA